MDLGCGLVSAYVVVEETVAACTKWRLITTAKESIMRRMAHVIIHIAIADAIPANPRLV